MCNNCRWIQAGNIFSSEPPGATILVDGIEVGKTPTTFSLDRKKGASFFGFKSVNIEIKKETINQEVHKYIEDNIMLAHDQNQ